MTVNWYLWDNFKSNLYLRVYTKCRVQTWGSEMSSVGRGKEHLWAFFLTDFCVADLLRISWYTLTDSEKFMFSFESDSSSESDTCCCSNKSKFMSPPSSTFKVIWLTKCFKSDGIWYVNSGGISSLGEMVLHSLDSSFKLAVYEDKALNINFEFHHGDKVTLFITNKFHLWVDLLSTF